MMQTLYPQIVFEITLMKLLQLKPILSIDTLISQLEALAKGQPTGRKPIARPMEKPSFQSNDQNWKKIVEHVRTKKPAIAAILEHGYLVQLSKSKITVSFPKESVFFKLLSEKDTAQAFEKIISDFFNSKVQILITEMETNTDTGKKTIVEKNETEIERLKKKALDSDAVKEAQKVLNGRVIDIRVTQTKKESRT